jgi:5-methylcytosine-specific restriction enzyme A
MSPTIKLLKRKKRDVTHNSKAFSIWYNTARWKKLRAFKVLNNPVCELCEAKGITKQTEEVHHIVFIDIDNPDPDMIYNYDNLQSLCKNCHCAIHNEANRRNNS